jgi:hypothetical protein
MYQKHIFKRSKIAYKMYNFTMRLVLILRFLAASVARPALMIALLLFFFSIL